jgi:hypothetical protein
MMDYDAAGSANLYNLPIGKLCWLNVELANITLTLPEDIRLFAGK